MLDSARSCLKLTRQAGATLIINDRIEVALTADADGVHLGQTDLAVDEAREIMGDGKIIGVSTHSIEQFRAALETSADYIALGPIFPTTSKEDADPVIGLEMLREARGLTDRPIVAIGGITIESAAEVMAHGADVVAVISALYPLTDIRDFFTKPDITGSVRAFLEKLEK